MRHYELASPLVVSEVDFALWFLAVAVGIAYSVGIAMIQAGRPDAARICFTFSAALGCIGAILWTTTTSQPWYVRLFVVAPFGAMVLYGLAESIRWAAAPLNQSAESAPASTTRPQVDITGTGNVTSVEQSGGITTGTYSASPGKPEK